MIRTFLSMGCLLCIASLYALGQAATQPTDSLGTTRDTLLLEEVVVSTGLQQLPKERATGSFSHISRKQLDMQVSTGILPLLESTASSYQVDRRAGQNRPILRGIGTISGPTTPLVILDNFPYEGDIEQLNPNDVADITILKDAAAASIWGARAANGVIVITTKKGQAGDSFSAEFSSLATVGEKPDLGYLRPMAAADLVELEQYLYGQDHYRSLINSTSHPKLPPVVELLLQRGDADAAGQAAIDARLEALKGNDIRRDLQRYFYRNAVNQQYALNLRGGGARMGWSAMAGYDRNISELDATYQRVSLRLQHQYRPIKALEVDAALLYTNTRQGNGRPGIEAVFGDGYYFPYMALADNSGQPLPYARYRQSFVEALGADPTLLPMDFYPLTDYRHTSNRTGTNDLLFRGGLQYTPIAGLTASLRYQFEQQQQNSRALQGAESYEARYTVNRYGERQDDGSIVRHVPAGGILDLSGNRLLVHQGRAQVAYARQFGRHDVSALLGNEWRHRRSLTDGHRLYGYDPEILAHGAVDYAEPHRDYFAGASSYIYDGVQQGDVTTRFVSLFANGAYTYDRRYTASFSARRDASNLFGLRTNDQWNLFWSAGAAWSISDEPFYSSTLLPKLKLRATYGASGNVDPGMVAVTTINYRGFNANTGMPAASFVNYYNPDLRWETSRMLNLAVDFGLRNNRLSGSVEYFEKRGYDLFTRKPLEATTGVGPVTLNGGDQWGRGVDVQLQSRNLSGPLLWTTQLNFSHYRDKVITNHLLTTSSSSYLTLGGTFGSHALPGRPVHGMYGYRWAGLDPETGNPQGYVDGEVSDDYTRLTGTTVAIEDLYFAGPSMATYFGSMTNTVGYRNWSVSFSVLYKFGYYFRRTGINYNALFRGSDPGHAEYATRWQQPGDEQHTDVPSLMYPAATSRDNFYTGSEVLIERGDHLRLQYVRLGYQYRHIQLYLHRTNTALLWKRNKAGLDPDAVSATAFPTPPSWTVGIRMNIKK